MEYLHSRGVVHLNLKTGNLVRPARKEAQHA
jgi:hypothetical protein